MSRSNKPEDERDYHQPYFTVWEGNNKLCCNGRVLIGSSLSAVFIAGLAINIPCILQEALILNSYLQNGRPAVFWIFLAFHLLCNILWLLTVTTDPGIIRRTDHTYINEAELYNIPKIAKERSNHDFAFQGHFVRFKFCSSCNIYRPQRSTHCHYCDCCIEKFDHHCPFLGTCIGKRNYRYFFFFILTGNILVGYVLGTSIDRLMAGTTNSSVGTYLSSYPYTIISIIVASLFGLFVFGLFLFHCYLVSRNLTTYEFLKSTWEKRGGNPFKKELSLHNVWTVLCARNRQTFLRFRDKVFIEFFRFINREEDSRRSVNRSRDNVRTSPHEILPSKGSSVPEKDMTESSLIKIDKFTQIVESRDLDPPMRDFRIENNDMNSEERQIGLHSNLTSPKGDEAIRMINAHIVSIDSSRKDQNPNAKRDW